MKTITQEELKEVLDYSPETGVFTRKVSNSPRVKVGDVAGSVDKANGYRYIKINGKRYLAHRLAFLYMTGEFPPEEVDHISHSKDDNRWVNLRVSSHQDNQRNRSINTNNKSGFTGVSWYKSTNKWMVQIKINGKKKHLGYFKDLTEAINARKKANSKYKFHKNHGE
jgi:hypothetical protein